MRSIKALCAIALAVLAVPMFAAGYIKFDGVDGEAKAAGHDKWIELNSVQFAEGACTPATRAGAARHASIELVDAPAALLDACATQKRFASVVVDIDGRRHTLQNVTLAQCPTPTATKLGKGARVVIRIDFATCSDPSAASGHVKVFDGATGQLIGMTPTPMDVKILKTTLRGKTATATFVRGTYQDYLGRQPSSSAARVSKIESLTIKQTNTNAKISFTNAVITGFADGPEGPTLTFEFESMTGSPADYLKLGAR
jgi:hypothetical protein